MKNIRMFILQLAFLLLIVPVSSFKVAQDDTSLNGAWEIKDGNTLHVAIIQDNYFMVSIYNKADKKFLDTFGGTCKVSNKMLSGKIQFTANDKEKFNHSFSYPVSLQNNKLTVTQEGNKQVWTRIDKGEGALAGNWRISQREQDGKMGPISLGMRRTLKLLSGTRFQWAAINIETGEFSGTGGGTYTFKDGKYTENIEFFSRDDSRVGASLSFDGKVDEKKDWHHSGLSSKGDKIYEVWTRLKE
jgi:hypothetical protein